jgi:hypothetical protein
MHDLEVVARVEATTLAALPLPLQGHAGDEPRFT